MLLIATGLFIIVTRRMENTKRMPQLTISDKVTISVDIEDTDEKRALGYSGHKPITFSEGKLFVFSVPGNYLFWMKDMLFDLDFIYIRKNKIVDLKENIPSPQNNKGEIAYVNATVPFDSVLEVKSGFVKKYGVRVGNSVKVSP